jgi:hypothetical protein
MTKIRPAKTPHTRVQHTLVTNAWMADVQTLEAGIREFGVLPAGQNECYVSMFEITGDPQLHVNVTHTHETKPVNGWAGPGVSAAGFVHNRTFDAVSTDSILHDIHRMVFAPRA